MVVEAWLTDSSMHKVAELMGEGSPYESVWLAGPVLDRGFYLADQFRTAGEMGSATLQELGVPAELLHVAPAADSQRHRTHTAASKLKGEFDRLGISLDRFDVITIDVHARRSRLVYQKVFGDEVEIGVIALEPNDYDADNWFRTSAGMKNTIVEAIAYLYEKLADGGR